MKRIVIFFAFICLVSIIPSFGSEMPDQVGHDEILGSDTNVMPGPDRASQQDTARWQPDEAIAFAQYDTLALEMDLYFPLDDAEQHRCIIFSYGGGFIQDNQRHVEIRHLCRNLADDGFVVVAANYRLGLRGVQFKGPLSMVKPLENAVMMAAEDVMKVTRYVLDYAAELTVDPQQIVLMGSSAGAITSLQCDYERCNRTELAQRYLPEGFRYAGIIAFAGAIYSTNGLKYTQDTPAPTLLLHGTADKLVPYKQVKAFGKGFYGSDAIAKRFKKSGYPYKIERFTDEGHAVAARYLSNHDDVIWFIDHMVTDLRHYEIDETIYDPNRKKTSWDTAKPGTLYK